MNKFKYQDVRVLLTGLKNVEGTYPTELQLPRRDAYIEQAIALGVLIKAGQDNNGVDSVEGDPLFPFHSGKILELLIVSAIILETVMAIHAYRNRNRDFFNDLRTENPAIAAKANLIIPSFDVSDTGDETVVSIPTPAVTATITEGPAFTPIINSNSDNFVESEQTIATPAPKENPGNHYGNTPKPDREKDNSSSSKDKEDKK